MPELASRKKRRDREKKERAALKKKLDDYVKEHVALGTATGRGYEKEVQKLQDAIDEHYSGTIAGKEAARQKKAKQAAATESAKLETQITELREAPVRQSRATKRKLEGLEEELEKERKKARGVKKDHEARAAKTRSEATSAVSKLRSELVKAARERRAEDVAKLEKELAKAERRLAKLEANDRDAEALAGLRSRIYALKESASGGTVLARNVGTVEQAFEQCMRLRRADKSAEIAALREAVVKLEGSRRGDRRGQDAAKEALEAVKPGVAGAISQVLRKRRRSQEADQGVEDAESALVAAKRRRSDGKAGDDDVKEAEKALVTATRRQDVVEAIDERAALREKCIERLDAMLKKGGGGPHLARALRDAREALDVFAKLKRPVSEEETDALNNMMDALNGRGPGIVDRRAKAIAAVVEASAPLRLRGADLREAAARDVADLEAQLDALPEPDVDGDVEEERVKIEAKLEKAKARVANLERNDELSKVAKELSRGLRELEASGTGDAAYEKSLDDADAVVTTFRVRISIYDLSEAKAKLRDMVQVLRDSPGRSVAARTARDAAVTKAREALMTYDEIAKAAFEEGLAACARRGTTSALDAYDLAKDGRTALPLDVSRSLAYALSQTAIAKARERVDALEPLRDTLSRRDQRDVDGLVEEATDALKSLERQYQFLVRRDEAEEALSRIDGKFDALRGLRNETAALDRFKAAASTACTALGIATAFRGFVARKCRAKYDRVNEEEARLRHELEGLEAAGGSGSAYDEELEERRAAWKAAFDKTNAGRAAAALKALVHASAASRRVLPERVLADGEALGQKGFELSCGFICDGKKVYLGVAKRKHWRQEALAAVMRDRALIRNADGGPISEEQVEVVAAGHTSDNVAALYSERFSQYLTANCPDHSPWDYLMSQCGGGTLAHKVGDSTLYVAAVTKRKGDIQRPSPFPLGRAFELSRAFAAELRARASSERMPARHAEDLDARMIKDSPKRPVYHAYTRGPWSVHRWTKSLRSPYENEQRWLWPSAEAARKWTQDKIDQKTSERGGYAIEDDDE